LYDDLQKKYTRLTKAAMKKLGVYKKQFDITIDTYAGLLAQYEILTQRLVDSGMNIEAETQRGGPKKTPTLLALEKLRTDMAIYADRLLLNPKALLGAGLSVGKEQSKLTDILAQLDRRN